MVTDVIKWHWRPPASNISYQYYRNKDRLSEYSALLLQRKPYLGRTKPSTGPQVGHSWISIRLGQWFSKWSISTPRGHLDRPRGRQIVKGSNGGHWMARGSMNNCWGVLEIWNPNSKLLLIGQGMQTAFFNKSNKMIKSLIKISATVSATVYISAAGWSNLSYSSLNVHSRGGQTCSMYEPQIVKPELQRAAT